MTRLVGAELLKVRTTRLFLWLGLLTLALEALVISLHVAQDSLSSLAEPKQQRVVVSIAAVSALISLILGVVASAGEFAHGTIGQTLLVAPVRERVAAAKLVAGALAGAALAVVACVFAWGLAAILLSARSVTLHLGSGHALRLALGTIIAAALTGAFGIGFGALLRRQTAAIVIALVWLLVGEPLLGVAGAERYGPGHVVATVVEAGNQGSDLLRFGAGLGVALVYVAIAGVLGAVSLARSDIT
jgi:ABC-type transport system involved in multi-copper enzyme maturation permease subunit